MRQCAHSYGGHKPLERAQFDLPCRSGQHLKQRPGQQDAQHGHRRQQDTEQAGIGKKNARRCFAPGHQGECKSVEPLARHRGRPRNEAFEHIIHAQGFGA